MSTRHERLSEFMQVRRLELGMKTWRALALEADISYETLRALRKGENVAAGTTDALEKALQWSRGSIARVLEGGEPGKHASGTGTAHLDMTATAKGAARHNTPEDKEDPFDRMDRLYEEWKRDPEDRPFLEGILDAWEKRKTS